MVKRAKKRVAIALAIMLGLATLIPFSETARADALAYEVGNYVVNFNTGSSTVKYLNMSTGAEGYTSGTVGVDAVYLGTQGDYYVFMLSGVTGKVLSTSVGIVDVASCASISYYAVSGGRLYHYITGNVSGASYDRLDNGAAPSYLSAGIKYYSYDGHYFYTEYKRMATDYAAGVRTGSVNASSPYYNYYQFLSFGTTTTYSSSQLEAAISALSPTVSVLRGTGADFKAVESKYNINALLTLSCAALESGWGSSTLSLSKYNMFGIMAYDAKTSIAKSFSSAWECIDYFSGTLMAGSYLRAGSSYYSGDYLGNKAGGCNVMYASNPYWGEKIASVAYSIDKLYGYADSGRYTVNAGGTAGASTVSTRLSTPVLKSVTNVSSGVRVKWKKVAGATGYKVYRKTKGGSWKVVAQNVTTNKFTDKTAKKGTTYWYTVRAHRGKYKKAQKNRYNARFWSGYDKTGLKIKVK